MRLKQLLAASLLALGLYFGAAKTQAGQMPPAQLAAILAVLAPLSVTVSVSLASSTVSEVIGIVSNWRV